MEDIRELVHELKKSQKKARGLAKEVVELKTELDSANITIKEYQEKLHISSTEIHRFRNMSVSGEAEIEALKTHRLRSESETKADDERKLRDEIEKHKREAEFHKEEAGKSREEVKAERTERERERKEYEAHKKEFGTVRDTLTSQLEEAKRVAAEHRERAASVDNHLMSISELHEKLESSKAQRDELTSKLDEATENFIKEEIKSVKLMETVNELQHKLNEKEALEEECQDMRKELKEKDKKHEKQLESIRADLGRRMESLEEEHGEETKEWEIKVERLKREKKEEEKKRIAETRESKGRVAELEEELENVVAEKGSVEKRLKKSKERYDGLLREMEEGGVSEQEGVKSVMQQPMQQQPTMQQPMMQQPTMQYPAMQQPIMQQQHPYPLNTQATPFFAETVSALTEKCSSYEKQIASLETNLHNSIKRENVTKQHLTDTLRRLAKAEGKCNELSKHSAIVPPSLQVATAEIKLLKAKAQALLDERGSLVKKHENDVVLLGKRIQEQAVRIAQLSGLGSGGGSGSGRGGAWREASKSVDKENKHNVGDDSVITLSELKSHSDGRLKNYSQHRIVTPVRMGGTVGLGGGGEGRTLGGSDRAGDSSRRTRSSWTGCLEGAETSEQNLDNTIKASFLM